MNDTLLAVVVGVMCILALGVGAAGFDVLQEEEQSGSEKADIESDGVDQDTVNGSQPNGDQQGLATEQQCEPAVSHSTLGMTAVSLCIGAFLVAFLYTGELGRGLAVLGITVGIVFILWFLATLVLTCPLDGAEQNETEELNRNVEFIEENSSTPEENASEQGEASRWDSLPILGVALMLVLLVAVMAVYVERRGSDAVEDPRHGETQTPKEIGQAAGNAADQIESGAAISNGVYRAWAEMTDTLDIEDPETSTPTEFAQAARAAGIASEDVDELTALFEEVRYGTEEATPDREDRALAALRRIEQTYTEDGGDR